MQEYVVEINYKYEDYCELFKIYDTSEEDIKQYWERYNTLCETGDYTDSFEEYLDDHDIRCDHITPKLILCDGGRNTDGGWGTDC